MPAPRGGAGIWLILKTQATDLSDERGTRLLPTCRTGPDVPRVTEETTPVTALPDVSTPVTVLPTADKPDENCSAASNFPVSCDRFAICSKVDSCAVYDMNWLADTGFRGF